MKNLVNLSDLLKGKKLSCNVVCKDLFQTSEIASFLGKERTKEAFDVLNGVKAGPYRKEGASVSVTATFGYLSIESYGDNGIMCVDIILSNGILLDSNEHTMDVYSIITIGEQSFSVIGEQTNLFANPVEFVADTTALMASGKRLGVKHSSKDFDFFREEGVKWFVKETVRTQCSFISPFKEKVVREYSSNRNYETRKGSKLFAYHEIYDNYSELAGLFSALRFGTKVLEPMQNLRQKDTDLMLASR